VTHAIAHRVGRFLEQQGLLERDAENSYLTYDETDDDPMTQLLGSSITYRIAVGPQAACRRGRQGLSAKNSGTIVPLHHLI
jgi:hypothetical protein